MGKVFPTFEIVNYVGMGLITQTLDSDSRQLEAVREAGRFTDKIALVGPPLNRVAKLWDNPLWARAVDVCGESGAKLLIGRRALDDFANNVTLTDLLSAAYWVRVLATIREESAPYDGSFLDGERYGENPELAGLDDDDLLDPGLFQKLHDAIRAATITVPPADYATPWGSTTEYRWAWLTGLLGTKRITQNTYKDKALSGLTLVPPPGFDPEIQGWGLWLTEETGQLDGRWLCEEFLTRFPALGAEIQAAHPPCQTIMLYSGQSPSINDWYNVARRLSQLV